MIGPPSSLERRLPWVLAALCLGVFAGLAPHLLYPDLNLDYPFVDGDSHDWIANGLRLAGHDVRYSGRPPLLPLALALLDRLGALPWWPLLGLAFYLATVVGFFTLAARRLPAAAAFAAALVLLAAYSLQGLALDLMADVPASCLILWSARAFLTAADRPRHYAWSGLLSGLAALTQPVGLLVVPAAAATLWVRRRRDLATRWPWIGAALAAACQGLWTLVRRHGFAVYGDSLKDPWRLFGFHLSAVRFYLWNLVSMLGLPACLLLAAGIAAAGWELWRGRDSERQGTVSVRDDAVLTDGAGRDGIGHGGTGRDGTVHDGRHAEQATAGLFALLLFAALLGFITFFYLWEGKRFVVYAVWPAGLLIAAALAPLARMQRAAGRACFAAVSALAIGGAALPLPLPARDGTWAALCPLPPLAAHFALAGGPVAATGAAATGRQPGAGGGAPLPPLSVAVPRPADLLRWTAFGRAAAAWAERPRGGPPRPAPALFAGTDSALYLFDRPDDGGGRYRTITRLSNALRKPVRFVPRSALAPYWALLAVSPPVQLTADYAVHRVEVRGLAGSWLLVTPGGRPLEPRLLKPAEPQTARAGAGSGGGQAPTTGAGGAEGAAAEAAAIASWIGRGYAYVALFPSPKGADPAELYLLFLLRSTELYVVEPPDAPATRALLARSPVESQRRIGAATVLVTRVGGQRTAVISFGG
ncbi:MAG TPA: glycosyltransferase family 39 protein [Thermoanaerobaculia bacterium]|nr:glycosyltransferase family 39 protein [Thermoanaerobaculia bacterium]